MNSDNQVLRALLTRPIAFHPALARLVGRATAGIFLSQLLYWCDRSSHEDGWVYKTASDWEFETTLSEDEQRGARKLFADIGIVESAQAWEHFPQFSKFDKTLCYRVNFERLEECLQRMNWPQSLAVTETGKFPPRDSHIPITKRKKSQQEQLRFPVHTTESTPQSTSETTTIENAELEELVMAALWAADQSGKIIENPSGWKYTVTDRLKRGVTVEDFDTLKRYRGKARHAAQVAKQRDDALHTPPMMDSRTIALGEDFLRRGQQRRNAALSD